LLRYIAADGCAFCQVGLTAAHSRPYTTVLPPQRPFLCLEHPSSEAHLSTSQPATQARPWFPFADGDEERPSRDRRAAQKRAQATYRLTRHRESSLRVRAYASLRRRADFARVARIGRRRTAGYLTCLVAEGRDSTRIGMTVSAQVGGAVDRNRVRRRLRAILDRYEFTRRPGRDIVFIARPGAAELSFAELTAEVERTFGPPP
jgi:ribonuclease P protein component